MVCARTCLMHFFEFRAQLKVEVDIAGISNHIEKTLLKVRPLRVINVAAPTGLQGSLAHAGTKLFRGHWTSANPQHLELARHAADAGQVIKSRNQLPSCQVARSAKDHEQSRVRPWQRRDPCRLNACCLYDCTHSPPPLGLRF